MESRIRLNVLGITFSQVQAGAYALVLAEEEGSRRVPIIIGTPEAQSIAIYLEGLHPPRPLTHDLFIAFSQKLNVELQEVDIYKFEDGVFYSELVFKQGENIIRLDSRTSDAIALAIRTNAPIYTTEAIMREAGIILEEGFQEPETPLTKTTEPDFESMNLSDLENVLNEAIRNEDYEKASRIRDEINKKNK
jgi:bifunctional DNase/RNase